MEINFINIEALQNEAFQTLSSVDANEPNNPKSLDELVKSIEDVDGKIAPIYNKAIYEPIRQFVNALDTAGFNRIATNSGYSQFFFDFIQAILQSADPSKASAAFEEVVGDLYDGFLSAEDRRNIKSPDHDVVPPIVKWGNAKDGPYTLPIDFTKQLKVKCAIVSLPPVLANGALAGWACLGHETAGHDILHADTDLLHEMSMKVKEVISGDKILRAKKIESALAQYWSARIDETAADIMGVLNMGPAAPAGMIPFFCAFLQHKGRPPKMRSTGPANDEHPADVLRVMLGAAAIQCLSFSDRNVWAEAILKEGLRDLSTIVINDNVVVEPAMAQRSAILVAQALTGTRLDSLASHSLLEIQDWTDRDEKIVSDLRAAISGKSTLDAYGRDSGIYAAHTVAAALYEGLQVKQDIKPLFDNMITMLKTMHDSNPNWGPLYTVHPGNLRIDKVINV